MDENIGIDIQAQDEDALADCLETLRQQDIVSQLLDRSGRMAELGSEGDDIKLDWVDGVAKALTHPEWLQQVEQEAADILDLGIRHLLWAGMGGSVQTLYTLRRMGFIDLPEISIFPLDSTDPATLNCLAQAIVERDGGGELAAALQRSMMIGVAMGMTSEEPITHLEWFDGLLREHAIPDPGEHIQVMTLPGSYLDQFAKARGSRMAPIQLDGENHTGGRFSAPATRVFVRAACLALMAHGRREGYQPAGHRIAALFQRALQLYQLTPALSAEDRYRLSGEHPFIQLGAFIAQQARDQGRNKVVLALPPEWQGLAPWVEQVVEESLGKRGKGFLVFYGDDLPGGTAHDDVIFVHIRVSGSASPHEAMLAAMQDQGHPVIALDIPLADIDGVPRGLAELATVFNGWQLTVAVYGYLHDIVFAGQPAVEAYKRYARELRDAPEPVTFREDSPQRVTSGSLTINWHSLVANNLVGADAVATRAVELGGDAANAADCYAAILGLARNAGVLGYWDFTFNGEVPAQLRDVLKATRRHLVHETLGIQGKIRTGPADYHSTEQSETDGPPEVVSLRAVAMEHEPVAHGEYSDKFLLAQARGTWQAMEDAGRWIVMLTMPRLDGETTRELEDFFSRAAEKLQTP